MIPMMSRVSIKARLVVLCTVLLSLLFVSTVYLTRQISAFNTIQSEESRLIATVEKANRATRTFGELKYWLSDHAVSLLMRSERNAATARAALDRELAGLEAYDSAAVGAIHKDVDAMTSIVFRAIDAYTNDERVLGNSLMAKAQAHIYNVDKRLGDLLLAVERASAIFAATVEARTEQAILFSIIVVVVGTTLGLAITVFVLRSVTVPLRDLVGAMQAITAGKLDAEIPRPEADEFGNMARTLDLFRDSQIEHQRSEARLRESENRYRDLIEGSIEGIMIHRGFKVLFANQAFAEIFGFESYEEILALDSVLDIAPSHEAARLRRYGEARLRGEEIPTGYEYEGRKKDGSVIWLDNRVRRVSWGGALAIQSTVVDVTDRKVAEEALQESGRQLAEAQHLGKIGHWRFDFDTPELYWSDEIYRIYGLDPAESIESRDRALSMMHRDDVEQYVRARDLAIEKQQEFSEEFRIIRRDGETRHILVRGRPQFDDAGKVFALFGTGQDITDRKRAEINLRESEARIRTLVTTSPVCIHEIDLEGRLVSMNPAGLEMMGVGDEAEICGMNYLDIPIPEDREHISELMNRALQGKGSQFKFSSPGEVGPIHFLSNFEPIKDENGKVIRLMGVTQNITELEQMEQALRESEERHRRFAADIAHELRTPLAVLRSNLDNLDEAEETKSLRQDVDAMTRMVGQLLAMARLGLLESRLDEDADVRQVCIDVATHLAPIAVREGHSIEVTGSDVPVLMQGNRDVLEQAVRNLVENAIRYSARGTLVTIEVGADATVRVIDRGEGVAPHVREKIFERFERADRRDAGGSGLGLAIVKRSVEAHQGSITIEENPSSGAIFTIRFPADRLISPKRLVRPHEV